jgi:threonine/homoserine/homoserine lactone efflux protein
MLEAASAMTEKLLFVVGVTTLCMLTPGPDMFLVMRNTLVDRPLRPALQGCFQLAMA